jgi:hypothetical protein
MADDQQMTRDIARQYLDAIEAAIVNLNARLSSTTAKFERSLRTQATNDPGRLALELEQAAFRLERDRLRALREVAKTEYLRTFSANGSAGQSDSSVS